MKRAQWLIHGMAGVVLAVGLAVPAPADDAKKAEQAVGGVAHRVGKAFHKQVKDYHTRQARKEARHGNYVSAQRHLHKANYHRAAEHRQRNEAHKKEKAIHHD